MVKKRCSPYENTSNPTPMEVKCPKCGRVEEVWSDEEVTCTCGTTLNKSFAQET